MKQYKKIIIIAFIFFLITSCTKKEKQYELGENVSLTGTVKNKTIESETKQVIELEEPIVINNELVKEITINFDKELKDSSEITINGKLNQNNKNNEYSLSVDEIDDILSYVNKFSNDYFSVTIPTSIIKDVTIKEIENGFSIYSTKNMNAGGEILKIVYMNRNDFKNLQKNNDINYIRIDSNKEITVIAVYPTTTSYDEKYKEEYEELSEQTTSIIKNVKLK